MQMKTKTIYFWLGFTTATSVGAATLLPSLPGFPERASGRGPVEQQVLMTANFTPDPQSLSSSKNRSPGEEILLAEAPKGDPQPSDPMPDREPDRGPGRKD